mgnify:CR=1 FL=1
MLLKKIIVIKKYPNYTVKLAALLIIAGILGYYQNVAAARAEIVAENEAKIAEVEEYNQEVMLENARRQAASCYYEDGTYEGISAYLPREDYELDETYISLDDGIRRLMGELWVKVKIQ